MRCWWLIISAVACDAGKAKEKPALAPVPACDDAPVVATLVDAMPPPEDGRTCHPPLPSPATSAAPKWIGRRLMAGAVRREQTHETFTLQHEGREALVTVEQRHAKTGLGDLMAEPSWSEASVKQFLGTFTEQGDVVSIDAACGAEKLDLRCKRTTVAAAAANAVRGRTPSMRGEECGDPGRWVPGATRRIAVLHCIPFDEPIPEEWEKLAFAEAPGIEWLHVNDDCVIQGGGWRVVAADGAIAKIRN
jgi:hypothetical protein